MDERADALSLSDEADTSIETGFHRHRIAGSHRCLGGHRGDAPARSSEHKSPEPGFPLPEQSQTTDPGLGAIYHRQ